MQRLMLEKVWLVVGKERTMTMNKERANEKITIDIEGRGRK